MALDNDCSPSATNAKRSSCGASILGKISKDFFVFVTSYNFSLLFLFLFPSQDRCLITWKKAALGWSLTVTYSPEANSAFSFNKCRIYISTCWCWVTITQLMRKRCVNQIARKLSLIFNFPPSFGKQVKEGLEVSEVADYMRGLGFFPSDYQVECLHHELRICGKRKIPFEDLVKLFVNHSQSSNAAQNISMEKVLKNLMNSPPNVSSQDIVIDKSQLISILIDSGEKIDEKDAEFYLKELFRNGSGKLVDEISLLDLMHAMTRITSNNNLCVAQKL